MATIPANNNTGLYNTDTIPATTGNDLVISGNVYANNVNAVNTVNAGTDVTAQGNITAGGYFIGDGSLLTNIDAGNIIGGYGNGNVTALMANFGSNPITTTGNITAGYFIGDGSQLTGLPAQYGNANVAAYLPTYTGNLAGGNANITNDLVVGGTIFGTFSGNITGNLVVPGANTEILYNNSGNAGASANFKFDSANNIVTVNGAVNATGNITGDYIFGNGSQLTGLPATYGNANVAAYLPTYTGNLQNVKEFSGNAVGDTVYIGPSATTTNIPAQVVIHADAFAYSAAANPGSKTIDAFNGFVQINGTGVANTAFAVNNGATDLGTTSTGNLTVQAGYTANVVGNIVAGGIKTDGYYYANGTPVTFGGGSTYGNSNVSAYLASGTNTLDMITQGDVQGLNLKTSGSGGNIVGADYVSGNVFTGYTGLDVTILSDANVVLNPTGAGQVNTTANIAAGGIKTDGYYYANGTPVTFGGSYGNADVAAFLAAFGSNAISTSGNIASTGNVVAGYLWGDGSNITGVVAGSASTRVAVKNTSGGTLAKGTPVYATGTVGASTTLTVSASRADTASTMPCIGLLDAALNNNDQGYAISVGTLTTVDTSTFSSGQTLYVGATGGLTATRPAGTYLVMPVGTVGRVDASSGSIDTNVWNYFQLPNLSNGQIWQGNATGYPTEVTPYGSPNVASLLASFGSNVISSTANISTNANIIGGNVLLQTNNKIIGDFSSAVPSGRTIFQTNNSGTTAPTWITTIPGPNNSGTLGGGFSAWASSADLGNASLIAMRATTTETRIDSARSGTGSYLPLNFYLSNVEKVRFDINGNVGIANTSPNDKLSVTGTGYFSGNITGGNLLTTGIVSATGKITSGAVTYANTDGTNGQVLTTYGNGVTYFSTVSGGANTQIQFNDGGSFAGNANMTFDKTTGNIGLGNLILNTQQIVTTQAANVGLSSSITPNPGRIYIGSGYNGNTSAAYDIISIGRSSRLAVSDSYGITDGNSVVRGIGVQNYYTLNSNVTSVNTRISSLATGLMIGGGSNANTISGSTSGFAISVQATTLQIGGGTSGNLTGVGNTTAQYGTVISSSPTINAGSTGGNIYGYTAIFTNFGTANTLIGYTPVFTGTTGTYGNVYGFYVPSGTTTYITGSANAARTATNYYAFCNDDDFAQMKLGSVRLFHEYEYALASSSGAVAVDKNNGQVQFYTVSEDATMSFSNFVTSVTAGSTTKYQTDTVTVIVQQDATGRTITMPSGTNYKYANGGNTVPATANSISTITVKAIYNTVTSATQYLITISPEFT